MITSTALLCLTLNIYHESRGEPIEGQIAVSLVVLNRAKFNRTSICKEVYRPHQFSWTKVRPKIKNKRLFRKLFGVAKHAVRLQDYTGGATHYHAVGIMPQWAYSMEYVGRWGSHYFYKEK